MSPIDPPPAVCRRNTGGAVVAEATSPRKSPLKKIRSHGLSPRAFIDIIQGHQRDHDDQSSVEDRLRDRTLFGGGNESEDEDFQWKDRCDRSILGESHDENAALELQATSSMKSLGDEERNWCCSLCGRTMLYDETRLLNDKIASLEAQLKELVVNQKAAMGTGTPCSIESTTSIILPTRAIGAFDCSALSWYKMKEPDVMDSLRQRRYTVETNDLGFIISHDDISFCGEYRRRVQRSLATIERMLKCLVDQLKCGVSQMRCQAPKGILEGI